MATLPTTVDETSSFKFCDEFSNLGGTRQRALCCITSALSRAPRRSGAAEKRRLERVVMRHSELILTEVERTVKHAKDIDVPVVLEQVCNPVLLVKQNAHVA